MLVNMNSYDRNENLIRFIDSLDGKKHIGLIYDDPDFAKLLKFRFIKNGLQNGENCIYVTDEDSGKVVVDMITYGIPIRYFQTNKIIVYHQNGAGKTRQEIQENTDKNMEIVRSSLVPPFRIVGRLVPNIGNVDGITVQMDLEKKTHQHYHDFGGIVMCSYDMSKIEKTKRKKWIEELYRNHHHVIKISTKDGSEVVTASSL
jgi:hypothetical protein